MVHYTGKEDETWNDICRLSGLASRLSWQSVRLPLRSSIFIQLVVFLVVSALSLAITRPLVKRLRKHRSTVSTNADRLIGQQGIVTKEIKDPFSVGQVKVLGETWSAQSEITPVKVGAKVEVLEIVGVRLIVEEME